MIEYAHPDLEGLCRSPHDYPAKWAYMLTLYIDESVEQDDGYAIVAGYIGTDANWKLCMLLWHSALSSFGKPSLHMKELRGWDTDRNKDLLNYLGVIPQLSGLTLLYSSVKVSDYSDLVRETTTEVVAQGYLLCLFNVVGIAVAGLPEDERLEVIWEQQSVYKGIRESMFHMASRHIDGWKTPEGLAKIAKWSSMEKSMILEPSDYAAYALLQKLRDPTSRKSILCSPILTGNRKFGLNLSRKDIRSMLTDFKDKNAVAFSPLTKEQKQEYRAAFKQVYGDSNGVKL